MSVQLNPKAEVLALLVPPHVRAKMVSSGSERIERIEKILRENVELNRDVDVVKRILDFTEGSKDVAHQKLRRAHSHLFIKEVLQLKGISDSELDLIRHISIANGTFTISEEVLKQFHTKSFWKMMQGVERLEIGLKNREIVIYDGVVLKQLLLKQPPLESLTKKFKLQFKEESLIETQAKLLLCGEWFGCKLDGQWECEKPLNLTNVSFQGFCAILKEVETGIKELSDDYCEASDYLLFKIALSSLFYGQKEWDHWGDVGTVPALPAKLLEDLYGPCPVENKEKTVGGLKMKDTHEVFYVPPTIDGEPWTLNKIEEIAQKNKVKLNIDADIRAALGDRPIKGGRWIARYKPLEATRPMSTADKVKYLIENLPKVYTLPYYLDALIFELMPFIEKKKVFLADGPTVQERTLAMCTERLNQYQLCVGALQSAEAPALSEMRVQAQGTQNGDVVVVPILKYE
jgi:hypothetical protein